MQGADGKEAYTRAGDLRVTGERCRHHGQRPAGALRVRALEHSAFDPGDRRQRRHDIDRSARVAAGGAKSQVDRIKLVNPAHQATLQKGDDGLLRLKSGGNAPTDETVTVTSGVLESSNVNAAQSLVNMIELQRLYEFQIKSINSADTDEQSAERMMLTS